ncbi:MAG: ZIP family metal transporter [Syntrophothermus sp.]
MSEHTLVVVYGAAAGFSLFFGSLWALAMEMTKKTLAAILAFGAGVLISSLSFGLMEEAFRHGGFDAAIIGLAAGALLYYGLHQFLSHHPGHKGSHAHGKDSGKNTGAAIVLGALLDGLPEQFAIGFGIKAGSNLGLLVMAAVFLSNLPESIAATKNLIRDAPPFAVVRLWLLIGAISTLATLAGYSFAEVIPGDLLGGVMAFAAGAVLAMIADTMLPEAFADAGRLVSLATVAGFLTSFIISRL